jgi:hypothetical protein
MGLQAGRPAVSAAVRPPCRACRLNSHTGCPSWRLTTAAAAAGYFTEQITPVEVPGRKGTTIVDTDEHIRPGVTAADLARLKPAAAAAVILADEDYAERHACHPLGGSSPTPTPASSRE